MDKKNIIRSFHILLFAAFLLIISPCIKSYAMIVDGQVVPWDGTTTQSSGSSGSTSTDNSSAPRGPANPDDEPYDPPASSSSTDDDYEYDTVPEGSDDANTSSNSGNEGNTGSAAHGPANPDSADSGQSLGQSSSNDTSSNNDNNSNDNSNIVNIDNNIENNEGNTAVATPAPSANSDSNVVITNTTPAPKKEPGTFSLPFLEKKEGAPDPFEPGISLKERASRIWQSLNDKEKRFLEIGGGVIALDVVYHIVKGLVKSILKNKKKLNNKDNRKGKNNGEDADFERPELEFEPKSVVTCLRDTTGNRDLVDYFNKKKFIEEKAIGFDKYDELEEKLNDEKADLIVLDLNTLEEFEEFKKLTSEKDSFALIVDDSIYKDIEAELNAIKEEKKITGFVPETAKKEAKLIKLVLPLFKPEISGENAAEVIGCVADALGIPYVSDILDAAMNGKEIIETVKEGDMDAVDKANVIGGIAGILGFDSLQEITDIIDKVSMAKSVVNHESIESVQDATVNNE